MSTTHQSPPSAAPPSTTGSAAATPYQPCDGCGAPLDERQRYCVACGTRRKHANDPAARFLSAATKRRAMATSASAGTPGAAQGRRSAPLVTAALIAVIPIALGAGVLIGRSSGGGDGKLIAALRAQRAPVIEYSGAAGASSTAGQAVAADSTAPVSTFKLASGYAVELGTLPAGTDQAAAVKAEHADQSKGASSVGLIAQSDFNVKPKPAAGAYVIYAGSYSTAQAAQRALDKLKHRFPDAKVIAVKSIAAASASGGGKVLSKTRYGTAHSVSHYKPSAAALSQGSQVAQHDSHSTGTAASGAGLPDVVAVP